MNIFWTSLTPSSAVACNLRFRELCRRTEIKWKNRNNDRVHSRPTSQQLCAKRSLASLPSRNSSPNSSRSLVRIVAVLQQWFYSYMSLICNLWLNIGWTLESNTKTIEWNNNTSFNYNLFSKSRGQQKTSLPPASFMAGEKTRATAIVAPVEWPIIVTCLFFLVFRNSIVVLHLIFIPSEILYFFSDEA